MTKTSLLVLGYFCIESTYGIETNNDLKTSFSPLKGKSLQMRVVENALNTTFFDHILTL